MSGTQVERVLALLRERGRAGLNTSELQELPIVDGGSPVLLVYCRACRREDSRSAEAA